MISTDNDHIFIDKPQVDVRIKKTDPHTLLLTSYDGELPDQINVFNEFEYGAPAGIYYQVYPKKFEVELQNSVNHPKHYNSGNIECIDAMQETMNPEEFQSWLWGNCFKYIWRWKHKNGLEDLKKCQFYLNKLISELEKYISPT